MGPGRDQTRDPWICVRLPSVARHVTDCVRGLVHTLAIIVKVSMNMRAQETWTTFTDQLLMAN